MSDSEHPDYLQDIQPLLQAGKVEDALALAEKAIAQDGQDHQAWQVKGLILKMLGRDEEGDEALARAIAYDEDGIDSKIGLASEKALSGDVKGALELYQELINEDATLYEAWGAAAPLLSGIGNHEQALDAAQKAVELAPDIAHLHFTLGHCRRLAGQAEPAMEAFNTALEIDAQHPLALYEKGMILSANQDWDFALKCFDAVLEINPDDPSAIEAKNIVLEQRKEGDNDGTQTA